MRPGGRCFLELQYHNVQVLIHGKGAETQLFKRIRADAHPKLSIGQWFGVVKNCQRTAWRDKEPTTNNVITLIQHRK